MTRKSKRPLTVYPDTLDPFRVKPFAGQPRKRFRKIPQLAKSIRRVGQVTPILVTACDDPEFDAELVDGERRLQACRHGRIPVKVVFQEAMALADRFAMAVAANFCRQEHDCIEIAEAINRLRADGRTLVDIQEIFGKSFSWVQQHFSLLKLADEVKELLKRDGNEDGRRRRSGRNGRLTFSTALLLTGLEPQTQVRLGRQIVANQMSLAAARTMIYNAARKAGASIGTDRPGNRVSPKARFHQLWNAIDTVRHRLDPITDLPYAELSETLATADARERTTLLGQIQDVISGLDGIARTLRKGKPTGEAA